jgi:hypothetical protein
MNIKLALLFLFVSAMIMLSAIAALAVALGKF